MTSPSADAGLPDLVRASPRLDRDEIDAVSALLAAVTEADGVSPLSEHVILHVRHGGDSNDLNLLATDGGRLVGYAHLDATDAVEGSSAELAVHPDARGRGLGSALVTELLRRSPDGRLRLWAHGEHPAAAAVAAKLGFSRQRVLWQMRRSLFAPLPAVVLPDGISIRTFEPGRDEQAWIEINNRAFTDHPDQGDWGVEEIRVREQEPWFDPEGFFLADRDGRMVGFHWTKVHGSSRDADGHAHEPIGEVYVVGVDPAEQGRGLGPALTLVGLRHLRARGLSSVMLYVDESNVSAIRLYERLAFTRWDTDVSFSRNVSRGT